jgi:hypothetical protein
MPSATGALPRIAQARVLPLGAEGLEALVSLTKYAAG